MRAKVVVPGLLVAAGLSAAPAVAAPGVPVAAPRCTTSMLSIRLGPSSGAAGSVYAPIVWTNKSETTCTLYGYPGVAYVAPNSGQQVGAAATRNPQHQPKTVVLLPGKRASAVVQRANYQNYPKARCLATAVSGFRVYPPGSRSAEYLPFGTTQKACSTSVHQLSVMAVVAGKSGM